MNNGIFANFNSIPIVIIPDSKKQNKKHKKKRVNKKWAKRYGYTLYNSIEDGKVIMMNGKICVNSRTYYKLKSINYKLETCIS